MRKLFFKIFSKNGWIWGVLWFFIALYGSSFITGIIGDYLPDEYMGKIVIAGMVLFVIVCVFSVAISRHKKNFLIGFFSALFVTVVVMALGIIAVRR